MKCQLAWIIAFVSSIISAIHGGFPNFAWWTLVFMLFCIVGVTVTVASDSERTYHVAVSAHAPSRRMHLLICADRGIPCRRPRVHYLVCQLAGVFAHRCIRGCGGRIHPPVHDRGKRIYAFTGRSILITGTRSCGSFITDRNRKQVIAPSSTRTRCTRSIPGPAARARCRMAMVPALRLRSQRASRRRCIHQPN